MTVIRLQFSHAKQMSLKRFFSYTTNNEKGSLCCVKSAGCTHDILCHGTVPHIWEQSKKAQKRYKGIEFITGCRASIRGALCLQSATTRPFKSCTGKRKRQHLQKIMSKKNVHAQNEGPENKLHQRTPWRHLINLHTTGSLAGLVPNVFTLGWTSGYPRHELVPIMPFVCRG